MTGNNAVNYKISLNAGSVALVLGILTLVLLLASLAGQLAPYFTSRTEPVVFLSLDAEQNLPTFFSVLLILLAALLLTLVAVFKRTQGASYAFHWAVLALGFLMMALDEATSVHEKLYGPMSQWLGADRPAVFNFAWVVPCIVLVLVIGLYFLRFLLHLPAKTRLLFCTAGVVYLGGAIGFEMIGGYYYAMTHEMGNWVFITISTTEESLEMVGMIIFIFALLGYMAETLGEVRFRFEAAREPVPSADRLKTAIPLPVYDSPVSPSPVRVASRRSNRSGGDHSGARR